MALAINNVQISQQYRIDLRRLIKDLQPGPRLSRLEPFCSVAMPKQIKNYNF